MAKGTGDQGASPVPTQRAALAETDELEVVRVDEVAAPTRLREHAGRALVEVSRDTVAKRLVRTKLVVLAAEVVEGPLLSAQGAARRHGGVELEGEVHALMAAVLLRLSGFDPFVANAEL